MPPHADEYDENALVPLAQFRLPGESGIVIGLLRSAGIQAVHGGQYDPRGPKQILVPFKDLVEANRLIAGKRDAAPPSVPAEEIPEPRSIMTAITWVLAVGISVLAAITLGRFVAGVARSLWR